MPILLWINDIKEIFLGALKKRKKEEEGSAMNTFGAPSRKRLSLHQPIFMKFTNITKTN